MGTLIERKISTIQIKFILNNSKKWEVKWSVHSEKGNLTRKVAGKLKGSSHLMKITQSIKV